MLIYAEAIGAAMCCNTPNPTGFNSLKEQEIFLYLKATTTAPGHIRPPIQGVRGVFFQGSDA